MAFNIQAARNDGVSDAEIADHLAGLHKFNVAAARADGVGDSEIADHLAQKSATLAKVKNAASETFTDSSVMDKALPASDPLAAIRAGINVDKIIEKKLVKNI